ncbi:patatin-like phospholipase family protein [Elizabethkingia sp. M8]|uniref:patatin-like phospholipase family protein n=1 Tax=Elizabethkingia sp. M8 TaxID=2796140 RepID=UPI0021044749|nr:patatin-like phospholipase family protein [Elizabethkingia sp. M8]
MKKICILSLDGGGIRGIISCIILRYMEEQLQKQDNSQNKLGDYFDLVAGSSTGGLITSIMLYPDENRNARYSIQKGLELYSEKGEDIFQVSFFKRLINPFGLFNEKISQEALEKNLNDFFGKTGIKRTDKTLPDYKLRHRKQKGKAF